MASARFNVVLLVPYLLLVATICDAQLSATFYQSSCPKLVPTVRSTVASILNGNPNLAGAFLRLHFHDCWVNGCDGSVLLSASGAERDAHVNFQIRGFAEIDQIKTAVENICPNTVSCADIVIIAAREAVNIASNGGVNWDVVFGRRDSRTSVANDADTQIPFPTLSLSELNSNFGNKGFSSREMIVLSGGHTIGRTHCNGVAPNLYNFSGVEDQTNPNLDPTFAAQLKQKCPKGNTLNILDMDLTKNRFDNQYYVQVFNKKGVFISDTSLITTTAASSIVQSFTSQGSSFFREFGAAMAKMGRLSPLTGTQGEIRKSCQVVN